MGGGLLSMSILLPVLSGIVSIWLGLTVLRSDQKGRDKLSFSVFSFFIGFWSIFISLFLLSESEAWAYWSAVLYYVSALMLIYGFTVYCISQITDSVRPWIILAIPVAIMAAGILATGGVVESVVVNPSTLNTVNLNHVWYLLYSYIFVAYSGAALVVLARSIKREPSRLRKLQQSIIARIVIVCLPAGAFFNLILPLFGKYDLIMVGPIFVLPLVIVVFYAMMRHHLFNIRRAVVRTTAYILSLLILGVFYYMVAYIVSQTLFPQDSRSSTVGALNVVLALVLVFIFQPVKSFFDRVTNSVFYRNSYSTEEFITRINHILTSTTDLRSLLDRVSKEIGATLKAEQSFLFAYHMGDRFVTAGTKDYSPFTMKEARLLDEAVKENGFNLVTTDELPSSDEVCQVLKSRSVELLLPLDLGGKVIGYLSLGGRRSGRFSSQDLRTLEMIADGLLIAIQNAISVHEIKDLNSTLQQRIDDATKELRESNEKLHRLDVAKDEFVSMASHQLRTPLTSVKGYISMVLDGDVGKITDMQKRLLGEAFTSSERMVHLINDFLNVSRLQTGKFIIDRRAVDLSEMVQQEVDSLQTTAKARQLTLKYRKPSTFPVLYIDEGKLRQVVMNFIDNAFYYSPENSTVTVSLTTSEGEAILSVKDSGMGVPKSEQKHLFGKFFRATNARKQRPDGTGVGLFLARKVVTAHGGSVLFESTEGKGSTFGFRLPVKKLSLAPANDPHKLED